MSRILPDAWNVPRPLRDRVGTHAGRQRLITHEGHSVLLLHKVPDPSSRDRTAVAFWRDPEGAWRCAPGRDGIATLRAHVDAYAEVLERLEEQLEVASRAHDYFAVLRSSRPVQRAVRNMSAAIQQQKELVPGDADMLAIRDRAYDLERLADLLVDDAHNGLQLVAAQRAEEQAIQSHALVAQTQRLNLLAALFLPTTALGAILGMNLESGLEGLPQPLTFWLLVALAFAVGMLMRAQLHLRPPR